MWQVFEFDQSELIDNYDQLEAYGKGACLAIAMKWCAQKQAGQSSLKFESLLTGSSLERQQLAGWMKSTQDVPLATLFENDAFRYYSQGKAITEVIGSTKGKINNMQAYASRLEQMSQWGRQVGLTLLDDRVGFADGKAAARWVPEMCRYISAPVSGGRTRQVIGLTGQASGHALAVVTETTPHQRIDFFDPNYGEYRGTTAVDLSVWLTDFIGRHYADLNHHWWVVKFG